MNQEIGRGRALANAGLVVAILALAGFALVQVASRQWRVQKTFTVAADFATIGGLEAGQRVRIQGIDAGVVAAIVPPSQPGGAVRLVFRLDERLRPLVRADARARIVTEGVVGAKAVEIAPGRADAPPLDRSAVIAADPPIEMNDVLREARSALGRIDAAAAAAERGLGEINAIAGTIRKGEGSLGKLVQDDDAYRKLVALSEQGEETLEDLEENLAALKRTWPLSRYFRDRSFFDRDRILYHPGAERDSRTLSEADLFEPGRAVLTAAGRKRLDEVAAWFNKVRRPSSEVVIAAFTDDNRDQELARLLTQEQADAVRAYLVAQHSIQSAGWFTRRKVAAVGFGSETPPELAEGAGAPPPRRVEIILFTPQI
jgi:phospholipid/cholesterol/gamma-HCH transport system substrate-binding protein